MTTHPGAAEQGIGFRWGLWIVLAAAWFMTTPLRPMFDPDEGRYAEIPREMLQSGDWVTPRLNGLKYFEKPPLQYWATAATYEVFGLSEWSSRLWAVGLAFGCLPLTYLWVRRLYGATAAVIAAVALAASPYFGVVGHLNLLDEAFTFWLAAAVFAFALAQAAARGSAAERRWMLIAWSTAALAVLSKGIVVGVLAGTSLAVYSLLERDGRIWGRLHLWPGLAAFLLIAAPWFVVVSMRNPSFPGFFFVHEHFARFLTTVHQRVEPWWFFLPLLFVGVLPWIVPLWRGIVAGWHDAAPAPAGQGGAFRPLKFLLVFCAVTLAFFSASGSKLAPYVLPMMPALAAVCAVHAGNPQAFMRLAARIVAGLVVFMAVGLATYSARRNGFVPTATLWWSAVAVVAVLAAGVITSLRRTPLATAAAATALAAIVAWQCLLFSFALTPPARSSRDLLATVRPLIGPATALYSVGQYRETISPYLARTLIVAGFEGELEFGLDQEPARRMSVGQFASHWSAASDAVAFFNPGLWETWRRQGLPGHVIAADSDTVVVSRL